MTDISKPLSLAGIHPFGSPDLQQFEKWVTRFLTREYQRLIASPVTLDACGMRTDEGEMWEQTDELMEGHYDEPLKFFETFLDRKYLAYTMAYYGETPEEIAEQNYTLEQAQAAKFRLACERTGLKGNEKIFSIGAGFGGFETYLAEHYPDIEVACITPSRVQTNYIRDKMADKGHPLSRLNLRLIEDDFGTLPITAEEAGSYDMVFSVGAFEHVRNWQAAFSKIAGMLKPGGKHFQHLIASKIVIPQFLDARETLIGKYYPGGRIWPFDVIAAQNSHLELEQSWFMNGLNYVRTLDEWHRNLWEGMNELYPDVLSEKSVKHWSEYFSLCKACFAPLDGSVFGVGHFVFRKR